MCPKLTKKLHEKYPNILMRDGKSILRGGDFEFRDGWYKIIEKFLKTVDVLLTDVSKLYPETHVSSDFLIMKEKMGTLHIQGFALRGCPGEYMDIIWSLVETAEFESSRTCEVTGGFGEVRNDLGWFQCLCDEEYTQLKLSNGIRANIMRKCGSCGSIYKAN